jgi:2-iminoacetate synthase
MSFKDIFDKYSWDDVKERIYSKSINDVRKALSKNNPDLDDFEALVSPAAIPFLERMAELSNKLTQERFGKVVQMYEPVYLSNYCKNNCIYCGFNSKNKINRKILNDEEIIKEAEHIKSFGYDNILIVTGESVQSDVNYLRNAIRLIRPYFSQISIEVQPMSTIDYESLIKEGLFAVLLYQETFNKNNYKIYHPSGSKSDFYFRLETHDKLGKAGIKKMGLGILLGLEDWRIDSFFTALHLSYLEKKYWKSKFSISFPRLRPARNYVNCNNPVSDKELAQLICAYRIFNHETELSLSTRENVNFRNNVIKLGITSISAGSKTNPGGYSVSEESLKQFEISDQRTPSEIAEIITAQGYEPVWKDWDNAFN